MGTSQEQPFFPRTRAPCVWVEPSPRLLPRITRNRLFPPSAPTAGALTPTALSAISQEGLEPVGPPSSSLTLHSVPQVSSVRPVDNPPDWSSGPGVCRAWNCELWLLVAEALRAAAEPAAAPTWDCSCSSSREPRLPPCIRQSSSILPPAASVVARLPMELSKCMGRKSY